MGQTLPILVVDDDDTILSLFDDALSPEYQVEMAHGCIEATDRLTNRRFSLLIIDLQLPVLDGATFVRLLRANPEFDGLPVLLMTDYPPSANALLPLPATRILHRPFDVSQLLAAVDEMTRPAPGL